MLVIFIKVSRLFFSYYSNWSQNRKSGGEFFPEDIDPSLCSHVIFAFGKIANKTIVGTLDNDLEMGN